MAAARAPEPGAGAERHAARVKASETPCDEKCHVEVFIIPGRLKLPFREKQMMRAMDLVPQLHQMLITARHDGVVLGTPGSPGNGFNAWASSRLLLLETPKRPASSIERFHDRSIVRNLARRARPSDHGLLNVGRRIRLRESLVRFGDLK